MDHKCLLEELGGPHAVHAELIRRGVQKLEPVAVRAWALPGRHIPAKYWALIVEIAADANKTVLFEELAESVRAA
jgi:hypothetical protein